MKRFFLLAIAAAAAALCLEAQEGSGGPPSPMPPGVRERLASLLPERADGGIAPSAAAQFYTSNLYEYMDGGAEPFHTYGMVAMAHREYKEGELEITADVFDMGDRMKAFGMYAAERAPNYNYIPVGAEGYLSEFALNFLQDRYYVKLAAFGDQAKVGKLLEQFAQAVAKRIGEERSMPAELRAFPQDGLVARSETYIVKAPLGLDFLAPAMRASYTVDGKQTSLVISLAKDEKDAIQKVTRLEARFKRSGKVAPFEALGAGAMRGVNKYEGDVIFFAKGRYTVLCLQPPAQAEAFLKPVADGMGAAPAASR